jgi:hypothetical protein
MGAGRRSWIHTVVLAGTLFWIASPSNGDCRWGCSTMPVPSCYASPRYPVACCRCCVPCCGHQCHSKPSRDRERSAERSAQPDYRYAAPVPIVSTMPVFAAPMMFASFPVMPAAATRAAEPDCRSSSDCHDRLNRLEQNVLELTKAMRDLQAIVGDQSRVLERVTQELRPIKE